MDVTARLKLIADMQSGVDKAKAEMAALKAHAKTQGKGMSEGLFGELGKGAKENIGELGGVLKGALGLGSIVAVAETFKTSMEAYDALGDTATKLGESAESLQRVGYAAKLSGSSLEEVAGAVLKLEKNLGDAENSKASEALERYGFSAQKIMGMPLEQKILAFAEAFDGARQSGAGYNDLLNLMGKTSGGLIPLFQEGAEGIKAMFGDAMVIDDAGVKRLGEMNDAFDGMIMKMKALTAESVILGDQTLKMVGNLAGGQKDWFLGVMSALGQGKGMTFKDQFDLLFGRTDKQKEENDAAIAEAEAKKKKQQEARDKQAQAIQESRDKANDKSQTTEWGKADDILNKIRKSEIAALPEGERLGAISGQIEQLYGTMDSLGAKAYAKNAQGLKEWVDDLKIVAEVQKKVEDIQAYEKALNLISKIRDAEKDRATLNAKLRDDAAEQARKTAEHREDFADRARTQAMDLLPDDRKRAALIEDLKRQLGGGSLGDLRKQIEQKTTSGDLEGASRLEKRYSKAIDDAKGAAALGDGQMSQRVGGAQNLINILTGKGPNQLGERQVDLLKDVIGVLNEIKDKTGTGSGLGNGLEDLTF